MELLFKQRTILMGPALTVRLLIRGPRPNVTKFYLMIPETISIETRLFPTLANDPAILYKFLKISTNSMAFAVFMHIVVT